MLEKQFRQQIDKLNQVDVLKNHIDQTEKYSCDWFNSLLELEYLLSGEQTRKGTEINIRFGKIERDNSSNQIIILKNPSSYIPRLVEDLADLSLQLHFIHETKNISIAVVNVKEFILRARVKSVANLKEIDFEKIQYSVIEIKNFNFILEKLKTAFKQLGCDDNNNLQADLTSQIEFIFGPPGTGKTTYLAEKRIIPLLKADNELKILVLTPTNKVADVLVKKIMELADIEGGYQKQLIRFGTTGEGDIESAGLLKDKTFDITHLTTCLVVTTIARFLYDGFLAGQLKDYDWDVILFDEASMIMLAQIIYVLYQQKNCNFIVAGDPFQIQPVVIAEEWKEENIYTLVGLNNFQFPKTSPHDFKITPLMLQYRSIPPLGALFSQFSYDGLLTHHRRLEDKKLLNLDDFELKEITVIKFPVLKCEGIYRSRRLNRGGTYQIYSAIFTVELVIYLSKQIIKHSNSTWKIGIVCPYMAQATLVEKMMAASFPATIYSQIQIVTGTVHRFQGDEFDIILNLLNPPPKVSSNIFLNKQNILNVAISRAKDYLVLIIPDIQGLDEINRLERLLQTHEMRAHVQMLTSAEVEQIMFNQPDFIEENSLIVNHQPINVYAKPDNKYEIRCEENAIDIQLNMDGFEVDR